RRTRQQSAVRSTCDGKSLGSGVFVVDEPLGGGDKIIEYVLLVLEHSRFVPFLAVFIATPQIGQSQHSAGFKPRELRRSKRWQSPETKSTIASQQDGIVPIQRQPLAMHDEPRHRRPVLRLIRNLLHLDK